MEDPFFYRDMRIYDLEQKLIEQQFNYRMKILVYSIVCFILGFVIAL